MQSEIRNRFSGLTVDALPQDVRFVCTSLIEPPEGLRELWITDDGIGDRLLDSLSWSALAMVSSVVIVADLFETTPSDDAVRVAHWLSSDQVAPPVFLLPLSSGGAPPSWAERFKEICKGSFDGVVLGRPSGYDLALALRVLIMTEESRSDQWAEELHDRSITAENLSALRGRVEGTMWSYLPQRLMIEFPPIDDDLAHISDREFAGYLVGERLPFGESEQLHALEPPMGARALERGEMVKVIRKSAVASSVEALRQLHRSCQILQVLSNDWHHPAVPRCLQIYHAHTCLYIRMELAGTESLASRLISRGPASLAISEQRSVVAQLCAALHHLHRGPRICHRGLKSESVVLSEGLRSRLHLRLVDFDAALEQRPGARVPAPLAGTAPFVAPEVEAGCSYDGMAADMWSCGVLLLELACGLGVLGEHTPWRPPSTPDQRAVAEAVCNERRVLRLLVERGVSMGVSLARWFGAAVPALTQPEPSQRWPAERLRGSVHAVEWWAPSRFPI